MKQRIGVLESKFSEQNLETYSKTYRELPRKSVD